MSLQSHAFQRRQPGQVIVLFALFLFVLVGFVALAVDAGFLMAERRQAQSAADAAAMAADKAYQRNASNAVIIQTGEDYAANSDDGDSIEANDVTITPLATYTVNGISYVMCVRADIEHDVTPFFVGAIYGGDWKVSATAVACTEPEPREYALIALDEDGDGITAGGTADVTITNGGGAMSNVNGDYCGSVSWLQADGPLDAVDGIDICNNANVESLPPNPSAAPVVDPLAGVAEPDCSSLPVYNNQNPAIADRWETNPANPNWIPDVRIGTGPGTGDEGPEQHYKSGNYTNGIRISNEKDVVFEPGLYCIGGGGLELTAGSSQDLNATGDDVMFYMYGNNSMFDIDGQGVNLDVSNLDGLACGQAACSEGIIIFYSRGQISGQPRDCSDLVLNGNIVTVEGKLYAPCSEIRLEGNGNLTVTGQVLGGSIYVRGGNVVTVNYVSDLDVAPAQVYLVE